MSFDMDKWKEELYNKILSNEDLTKEELEDLAYNCDTTATINGDCGRWTQNISSVIQLKDKFFMLNWERALTEFQENEFFEQPFEVKKVEKTVVITDWVKVDQI